MDTMDYGLHSPVARFAAHLFDSMDEAGRETLVPLLLRLHGSNASVTKEKALGPQLVVRAINVLAVHTLRRMGADGLYGPLCAAITTPEQATDLLGRLRLFARQMAIMHQDHIHDPFGVVISLMQEVAAGPEAQRAEALDWGMATLDWLLDATAVPMFGAAELAAKQVDLSSGTVSDVPAPAKTKRKGA